MVAKKANGYLLNLENSSIKNFGRNVLVKNDGMNGNPVMRIADGASVWFHGHPIKTKLNEIYFFARKKFILD